MSEIAKQIYGSVGVQDAVYARIRSGRPFTYLELCGVVMRNGGDEGKYRTADRAIQWHRRKGWIAFERVKGERSPVWSLTDAGRAALAEIPTIEQGR